MNVLVYSTTQHSRLTHTRLNLGELGERLISNIYACACGTGAVPVKSTVSLSTRTWGCDSYTT